MPARLAVGKRSKIRSQIFTQKSRLTSASIQQKFLFYYKYMYFQLFIPNEKYGFKKGFSCMWYDKVKISILHCKQSFVQNASEIGYWEVY